MDSQPRFSPRSDAHETADSDVTFLVPMAPRGDRLRRRGALIAAVIFFAAMSWSFMRRGADSEFNVCYLRAATRMRAQQAIHRDEPVAYAYPPAMAMLVMPLAKLPASAALGVWYLINVVAVSAVAAGSWRLIGGTSILQLEGHWLATARARPR